MEQTGKKSICGIFDHNVQTELTSARVHLAAGLPLKWVQAQRESFRQYLMQNKIVQFRYKGRQYEVEIAGCTVMPQCYSAVAEKLKDFKGMPLQIGSWKRWNRKCLATCHSLSAFTFCSRISWQQEMMHERKII